MSSMSATNLKRHIDLSPGKYLMRELHNKKSLIINMKQRPQSSYRDELYAFLLHDSLSDETHTCTAFSSFLKAICL